MCIICAINKGEKFTQTEFENCWDGNPHGGGYTYINPEAKLITFKSMDFDVFRNQFDKDFTAQGKYSPFLVHFRIASAGTISIANNHPFKVHRGLVMAHNGTISGVRDTRDSRSDTKVFVEEYLRHMPQNFLLNRGANRLIKAIIGSSNKLVFLNSEGLFTIFNDSLGEVDDGRWFSNSSYKYKRTKANTPAVLGEYAGLYTPTNGNWNNNHVQYVAKRQCSTCLTEVPYAKWNTNSEICDDCKAKIVAWCKVFPAPIYQVDATKLWKGAIDNHEKQWKRLIKKEAQVEDKRIVEMTDEEFIQSAYAEGAYM